MKRLLLYFIALTCAVCILSGCRKEEKKEDRKPGIEGVYWCPERMKDSELPEPIMFHDGILDSYKYVASEEEADKITQGTGVTVKKGYMLRYPYYDMKYTVTLNEDGISGTITVTDKSFGDEEVNTYVFSELTSDSVLIDFSGEPERYYSAEKCGFTVTGTVDLDW